MDKRTLENILNEKAIKFTESEIQDMIDKELEKDPKEMDTELIDICLEVLDKQHSNANCQETDINITTKNKKIKLIRIFAIAAIVAVILSIAIPVCAKFIHTEVSEDIVQFYSDHFKINLRNTNQNQLTLSIDEIIQKLNENDIEKAVIPLQLTTEEYSYDINISEDEDYIDIIINFMSKDDKISGSITLTKYKTNKVDFILGQGDITNKYDSVKQLEIDNMDVLVFSNDNSSYIYYVHNNIEYQITLDNTDFDYAIQVAQTINLS